MTLNTNMMNSIHLFPVISIFIFLIAVPPSYCDDHDKQLSACTSQYLYPYGRSAPLNISYPFWGGSRPQYCGRNGFEIECDHDQGYHFIEFATQKFRVLNVSYDDRRMTIARADLRDDYCPGILIFRDIVFDEVHFKYAPNVRNLSFFHDCDEEISPESQNYFSCNVHGEVIAGFYAVDTLQNTTNTCKRGIKVPVILVAFLPGHLGQALKRGFIVEYNADNMLCAQCLATRGICASNKSNSEQFICLCPDKSQPQTCPLEHPHARKPNRRLGVKLLAGFVSAIGGLTIIFVVICIFKRKNSSIITTETFWKRTKNDRDLEAFIRNYGSLAPKRHSFSNLKKITDSFKNKLGQGGYGGVYKGKLQDGQLVAVKLLNTSKGNGQEFINEVASISRTSHVNVVRLLGFCLEGSKRALIYEFMSNGSLEKFIHSTSSSTLKTNQHLGWEKLYQIALGIARGLEYLHRGCNTRILHFDIKPHNILLDEDFCPKIADFGLAKLCPKKESNVSLLEARGTIGYIAPEIYNRNFGEVSHKSDVYSYGMMVIEMVGGRKNLHLEVENSSEIYFPKWIYKHLDLHKEIKLQDSMTSEEDEIAKKMIIVGLWCIQTLPPDRPSMNKVIDMLQGSIEALQIPPDPFHSSSPRPTSIDSSTISIS